METTFFFDGKEDDGLVFIEVLWFDRDSEARDKIAALFTERWKKITDKIVTIVFYKKSNPLFTIQLGCIIGPIQISVKTKCCYSIYCYPA